MARYQDFKAVTYKLGTDKQLKPSQVNIGSAENENATMAIHVSGTIVHITREQAMEFFGLEPALMF